VTADTRQIRCVVGLMLGVAFLGLYMVIPRDWHRIAENNAYFFADVGENADGLTGFVFAKPLQRHVLFSLMGHPLYLFGKAICPSKALAFPTAIMGSAGVVFLYAIISSLWPGILMQAMMSMLYGVSAANLVYAGIPETYVPAAALVMAAFLVWVHRGRMRGWVSWPLAGLVLLLVGLMNPVILVFLLIAFSIEVVWKSRCAWDVWKISGVAVLCGLLTYLVRSALILRDMPHLTAWETVKTSLHYLGGHGSFAHFISGESISNVILNTLFFSIGGLPFESFSDADVVASYSHGFGSLAGYFHSVWGMLFTLSMVLSVLAALMFKKGSSDEIRVAWIYCLCHILFFTWFNPKEAFLYSPPSLGLFLVLLFAVFKGTGPKWGIPLLGWLLATVAANNTVVFCLR
jgi:hypothetical protein